MAKNLQGIWRLLAEFPWLWAMRSKYYPTDDWSTMKVRVIRASKAYFDLTSFGSIVWVYGLTRGGFPAVRNGSAGWDDRLGSVALFCATESNGGRAIRERVQYVAISNDSGNEITLFRAPKGMTMWQFLQQYDPHENRE